MDEGPFPAANEGHTMAMKSADVFPITVARIIKGILWFAALALSVSACSGCRGTKWALKKDEQVYRLHPNVSAQGCETHFPNRIVKSTSDTVFRPGAVVQLPGDTSTVVINLHDTVKITRTVTAMQTQHDTLRINNSKTVLDSAAAFLASRRADSLLKVCIKAQTQRDDFHARLNTSEKQKWWTWGVLAALVIAFGAWKFFKPKWI